MHNLAMKYVPEPPQPTAAPEIGAEVKALAGLRPAKPVQERTLPPMVVRSRAQHEANPQAAGEEKTHERLHEERRIYCRRIEHLPILLELRSGEERRRHNQRAGDLTEHVDIKT